MKAVSFKGVKFFTGETVSGSDVLGMKDIGKTRSELKALRKGD